LSFLERHTAPERNRPGVRPLPRPRTPVASTRMLRRRLLAVVASLGCVAGLSGCYDDEPFGIHFVYDLSIPVVLALCHSDHSAKCEHPHYRDHIKAGGATAENIGVDVRTEWAIETEDGRLLRCIVLYWKHSPRHDMDVKVSQAPRWEWPCPRETAATPRT
jgi:hypothetical protein